MKKYIIQIPETDGVKITNSGYIARKIYDVILEDNGECESFTRVELIKPTERTYPKIIEAVKEYVNEANNKK